MIPPKIREIISNDPYYKKCARHNQDCDGRITIEHVFLYAGRQISDLWNLIPLCERHHSVGKYLNSGLLNKEFNQAVALSRATDEDLAKYPKANFQQQKIYLMKKYNL